MPVPVLSSRSSRWKQTLLLLQFISLSVRPTWIDAQERPILRVNPGGPTARVTKVLFSPDGQRVIAVGEDKAARIWNVATGEEERELRGQVGTGRSGRLFAGSVSGPLLAVAGDIPLDAKEFDTHGNAVVAKQQTFLLFNTVTGQIVRPPQGGHNQVITALTFSASGTKLVSCSSDRSACLWNVFAPTAPKVLRDHKGDVTDALFSPPPAEQFVATACRDQKVRIWNAESGKLLRECRCDAEALALAWTPDGETLYSGSKDGKIRQWNPASGQERGPAFTQEDSVTSLALTPDGTTLLSGSGETKPDYKVRVWSLPKGEQTREFAEHQATIMSLAVSPDGRLAASADRAGIIYVWNIATLQVVQRLAGSGESAYGVAWSADGKKVAWGTTEGQINASPLAHSFDLWEGVPGPEIGGNGEWPNRAKMENGGRSLVISADGKTLTVTGGGKDVQIHAQDADDQIRCATFTPNGDIIIGSEFSLARIDSSGKTVKAVFAGHDGALRALALSPDGNLLASASEDKTVRLWSLTGNRKTVEPLLSLFRSRDGEWVAWTPAGYYNASPIGDRFVGWQVNRGVGKAADFYTAAKFASVFYRPDVIHYLFRTGSVADALKQAKQRPILVNANDDSVDINQQMGQLEAPRVQILSPIEGAVLAQADAPVQIKLLAGNPADVAITLVVAESATPRDFVKVAAAARPGEWMLPAHLKPGSNTIRVYATNKRGVQGLSEQIHVTYQPAMPLPDASRYETLHLLAIGINDYPTQPLRFTVNDATALCDYYNAQQGNKLFHRVDSKVLTDHEATRGHILDATRALCKAVTERDYVILFVSGHGSSGIDFDPNEATTLNKYKYFFVPADFNQDRWQQTGVPWDEVLQQLQGLPCPVLLILDTCHSGGAAMHLLQGFNPLNELLRGCNDKGIYALAACRPEERSYEDPRWQHGAFTKALLEALQGKARESDGLVLFRHTSNYLYDAVRALARSIGYQQTPKMYAPPNADEELPLGFLKPMP